MSAAADTCQIRQVRAGGGVLHGGQRGVDLERLGKVLGALDFELVEADAANKKGTKCRLLTRSKLGRWEAAHLSDVNVALTLRASLSWMMPSAV